MTFGAPGKQLGRKERQQNESDNFFHKTSTEEIQVENAITKQKFSMIVATPHKVRNRAKRQLRQILRKLTVNVPVSRGTKNAAAEAAAQ